MNFTEIKNFTLGLSMIKCKVLKLVQLLLRKLSNHTFYVAYALITLIS